MDLRDLAYFETIAELGHLGRAADRLGRSQPALTKSIQRLEQSLGTSLFQREGRRIRLTPAGELMLQRARQLRQDIEETRREVRDFASGLVGNIRLGCAATMAEYLLPPLVEELLRRAPEVTISLSLGQDDVLREALRGGRLDMAICSRILDDAHLVSEPLLQDQVVVVASREHPLFDGPVAIADLCRYRWVLPAPSVSSRRWMDATFQAHGLPPPRVQIETNAIPMLPNLIARTRLLSFVARETLDGGLHGMNQLREVKLAETTLTRTMGLAVREGAYLSPAAQLLRGMLREHAGRFAGE
ncbi:LysR family transcriptional regulator [Pseudomonas citronellolis]|uniref:LysR family transcriptional regulator n=1 Tax=Pseudomonas citronellolis TaxID=53408 RepID=A0A1A9KFW8_9PSED|nr:LysR family transcriptional regulator [Pseudomonas citronellolis]ANI16467.1 LysR family transcriptional regulator [Pseudomonas citronellolis]